MEYGPIARFTEGWPLVEDIRQHVLLQWRLKLEPLIRLIDVRHIFVMCGSKGDLVEALSFNSFRIGSSLFYIFKWTPNFSCRKDSSTIVAWVKLNGLDPYYFRTSFLREIYRGLGSFLKSDERTLSLTNPSLTRVYIEVDLSVPMTSGLWVGSEKNQRRGVACTNGASRSVEKYPGNFKMGHHEENRPFPSAPAMTDIPKVPRHRACSHIDFMAAVVWDVVFGRFGVRNRFISAEKGAPGCVQQRIHQWILDLAHLFKPSSNSKLVDVLSFKSFHVH
uniref:DUF4283 domain-containing protein n=1 Tax=Kalanchoe fedtschenkoi TaxID=63787 RepID=A0A7N0VKF6_KALFE